MRLFRRKPPVPCCADVIRIQNALDVIDAAIEGQRQLYPEDRDEQLIDLALDITEALSRSSVTGRS